MDFPCSHFVRNLAILGLTRFGQVNIWNDHEFREVFDYPSGWYWSIGAQPWARLPPKPWLSDRWSRQTEVKYRALRSAHPISHASKFRWGSRSAQARNCLSQHTHCYPCQICRREMDSGVHVLSKSLWWQPLQKRSVWSRLRNVRAARWSWGMYSASPSKLDLGQPLSAAA